MRQAFALNAINNSLKTHGFVQNALRQEIKVELQLKERLIKISFVWDDGFPTMHLTSQRHCGKIWLFLRVLIYRSLPLWLRMSKWTLFLDAPNSPSVLAASVYMKTWIISSFNLSYFQTRGRILDHSLDPCIKYDGNMTMHWQ